MWTCCVYPSNKVHNTSDNSKFLSELIALMTQDRFLTDTLKFTDDQFQGVCILPGHVTHRRIDIWFCKKKELGAARLQLTGNAYFNRSMRRLAKSKGYSLSFKGLFKCNGHVRVAGETEEEIFGLLGMPWKEPCSRSI